MKVLYIMMWVALLSLTSCDGAKKSYSSSSNNSDDGSGVAQGEVSTCESNGTTYSVGDRFTSSAGCENACSCEPGGEIRCTNQDCNVSLTTCEYGGQTYRVGESFTSTDGCNTCSCDEDGAVPCTEIACEVQPDSSSDLDYDSQEGSGSSIGSGSEQESTPSTGSGSE